MRDREQTLQIVRRHIADIGRTGTLELRSERGRSPAYCVRFRVKSSETGATRQYRLTIGDDAELHDIVRTAIVDRVRQQMRAKAAKVEAAKLRKNAGAAEREFVTWYPGSRSYRRQVRQAYRRSLVSGQDFIFELFRLLVALPRRKRPGRPLKNRLW